MPAKYAARSQRVACTRGCLTGILWSLPGCDEILETIVPGVAERTGGVAMLVVARGTAAGRRRTPYPSVRVGPVARQNRNSRLNLMMNARFVGPR